MDWKSQLIFWIPQIIIIIILLGLLAADLKKGIIQLKTVKNAIILIVAVYVLRDLLRVGLFYLALKKDTTGLGQYLLPGQGTKYFQETVWNMYEPFLISILTAILLVLIALIIGKISKRSPLDSSDILILALTSFIAGFPQVFFLLIGSFLLMIASQIFIRFQAKNAGEIRLRLSPYLIVTTMIMMILANFSFYGRFLNILKLI